MLQTGSIHTVANADSRNRRVDWSQSRVVFGSKSCSWLRRAGKIRRVKNLSCGGAELMRDLPTKDWRNKQEAKQ